MTGATQPSLPASTPKVVRRPSAPASAPASRPAFADDFAADPVGANLPSGWHAGDGQWDGVVNSGGTHQLRHSAAAGASHLWAGSAQWSDYSVSADVTTGLLGLGFAGVSGRYQDPANGYECGVGLGSQLQLWLVKDGVRTLLGASGVSLDLTAHHAVALDLRGGRLTCSLDGAPLVHATDSTFGSGRFALVTSAGEAAEFGNVRVSG
jgi:pectate lyase